MIITKLDTETAISIKLSKKECFKLLSGERVLIQPDSCNKVYVEITLMKDK